MSQFCPLCGKTRPEQALFCDDCAKKIRTEYEVSIPKKTDTLTAGESESRQPVSDEFLSEKPNKHNLTRNEPDGMDGNHRRKMQNRRLLFFPAIVILAAGGFFMYDAIIRKNNLDRSGWDAAVKADSPEGYLAYMEAHPKGKHFDEAQAGLRKLKSEEASAWEKMKQSDNVTELRDFLDIHPDSPYAPLVRIRLDSLVWIATLRMNTPESYADYIMLTENSEIGGDYIAEARKRHNLFSGVQQLQIDTATEDSIRTAIDSFFVAYSSLDHDGMIRNLAPSVYRFFDSGAATRERITGKLLVAGAQTENVTMKFVPDLESVHSQITNNNHYKINVPLLKIYTKGGVAERIHGYIMHIELDQFFRIVSIFETKPRPEAP